MRTNRQPGQCQWGLCTAIAVVRHVETWRPGATTPSGVSVAGLSHSSELCLECAVMNSRAVNQVQDADLVETRIDRGAVVPRTDPDVDFAITEGLCLAFARLVLIERSAA